MITRNDHEQAYETTTHHVAKLLSAIGEICTEFSITDEELTEHCEEARQAITNADDFLDPKPITTYLTVVYRNGRPINAFRNQQHAINFIIRTHNTANTTTRQEHKVAISDTQYLLTAEFNKGVWYFEPHDDERQYETPLLLVPIV